MFGLGSCVAGVDAEDVGAAARCRYRFLALPVRQRTPAWVGGNEIHQMRGTRSRHPDDDEGLLDRNRLDLGIPLDEVGQRQPVAQQANHSLAQGRASELGQAVVGLDCGHMGCQAFSEAVRVVQVGPYFLAGLLDGLGEHPIDVEFDVFGFGVLQDLPLDVGEVGRRQIIEVDVVEVCVVLDVTVRPTHVTSSTLTMSNISTAGSAMNAELEAVPCCGNHTIFMSAERRSGARRHYQ